jgi:hypothetical protein
MRKYANAKEQKSLLDNGAAAKDENIAVVSHDGVNDTNLIQMSKFSFCFSDGLWKTS